VTILDGDLETLSFEAYVYFYPLVTMEVTRRQVLSSPAGATPMSGPPNEFRHIREFPRADFRAVVRPNFDTLYSSAWVDLTGGPVEIHIPDSDGRFYMLPLLDMWTDVFANPGKRTTGTGPQDVTLVPPGHSGSTPIRGTVIQAPTPHVWVIGRTQTNGPGDYADVHAFQDQLRIRASGPAAAFPPDLAVDPDIEPLRQVNAMTAVEFFGYAADVLKVNHPHLSDFSQLARIGRLGIVPGQDFDPDAFTTTQRKDIERGAAAARQALIGAPLHQGAPVNGWLSLTESIGVYGNSYFKRAMVSLIGLGANPAEDAIYPLLVEDADGDLPYGENDYVVHFEAGQLPPVAAFWSVTMYDAEGFQVANELNRFALGDRDPLVYNGDGSLDLYLQRSDPGGGRRSNWLPAPAGPIGVTLRLYAPRPAALNGTWSPPPVRKTRHD
jgi:hypothetical protein